MDWLNYGPRPPDSWEPQTLDPSRPKIHLTPRQLVKLRARLESVTRVIDGLRAPAEQADRLRAELARVIFEELQPALIELVLDVLAESSAAKPRRRGTQRA